MQVRKYKMTEYYSKRHKDWRPETPSSRHLRTFVQTNLALSSLTWTHYLDDIITWAPTFEDHICRLRLVFDRLRAAGLKLKPTKCRFLRKQVAFLGHVVSSHGIKTDPEQVKAVKTWPVPLNVKELQSFLGLASYYRKFILGFSIITEPLSTV